MKFERFADDELHSLYHVLKERHGSYSRMTELLGEVLLELHRRGYVAVNPSKLAAAPVRAPRIGAPRIGETGWGMDG